MTVNIADIQEAAVIPVIMEGATITTATAAIAIAGTVTAHMIVTINVVVEVDLEVLVIVMIDMVKVGTRIEIADVIVGKNIKASIRSVRATILFVDCW
jgi:hypothetical protein